MSGPYVIASRGYSGPACPRCGNEIDPGAIVTNPVSCPVCLREFEAVRFDPPLPDVSVPRIAEAGPEGANPCGHHPGNVAGDHCTRCGVFMCALCRIETDGRVLCPACFERLADAGELPSLVAHHRDYGHMQLTLALLGLFIIFLGPVAGPASIFYGWKGLEQKKAMGDTSGRARAWLLFILGGAVTVGGLALFASMVAG
jgi:hypothetical protein